MYTIPSDPGAFWTFGTRGCRVLRVGYTYDYFAASGLTTPHRPIRPSADRHAEPHETREKRRPPNRLTLRDTEPSQDSSRTAPDRVAYPQHRHPQPAKTTQRTNNSKEHTTQAAGDRQQAAGDRQQGRRAAGEEGSSRQQRMKKDAGNADAFTLHHKQQETTQLTHASRHASRHVSTNTHGP